MLPDVLVLVFIFVCVKESRVETSQYHWSVQLLLLQRQLPRNNK